MADYLNVAVEAAQAAARIQLDYLGKVAVGYKTALNDLVTEADRLSEEAVRKVLEKAFPHHSFLGEEGGNRNSGSSGSLFRWLVDPIDGTTNYAHGVPLFTTSIALEDDEGLRVGVIYAPALGELYTAERGKGAFLNGRPIRVSETPSLQQSLLATGFPYRLGTEELGNLANFRALTLRTRGVRRLGSAALDLAWVAAGRLDGFWEFGLHPWDMAAGALLVAEAGGRVSLIGGEPFHLEAREVVATNGKIHEEMLAVLRREESPGEEGAPREMAAAPGNSGSAATIGDGTGFTAGPGERR